MFENIFGKKDDFDSVLKQLNKVIQHLADAKEECNKARAAGNTERADKYVAKIAELYDECNNLSIKYLQILLVKGDPQHGLDELESLREHLQSTETFFNHLDIEQIKLQNFTHMEIYKAYFLFDLQKYRRSLKSCEAILELNESNPTILVLKGRNLVKLGNNDEALIAFETAISNEWNTVDAWVGKGQILQAEENYSESLEAFETAFEIDDSNADAIEGKEIVLSRINENSGNSPTIKEIKTNVSSSTTNDKESFAPQEDIDHANLPIKNIDAKTKKVFKKPEEEKRNDEKPKGFACVAGMSELKEILTRSVIKPLKNPQKYEKFQVTIPNGILLFGPPGCGKTFIVEKLAEEVGYNFINVPPSKVGSKYIHETSDNIAKIFTDAKDNAPTILFFDEFEALVPKRESLGSEGQYKNEEINEFLTHLNNSSKDGILVVGATNQIDLIDPAVMRAGRMDKVILVPHPDLEARTELFRTKLSKMPHSADIDYAKLAEKTEFYSSSDITSIIEEAGRIAADQELDEINADLMAHVIEKQKPSITKSQIKSYEAFAHMERK